MPDLLINGRPVWEQLDGDNFFFYTSTKHWLVGPDRTSSTGCIHSKDMFLEAIPVTGWRTFNLWVKDPQIRVDGEEKLKETNFNFVQRSGELTELVDLLKG